MFTPSQNDVRRFFCQVHAKLKLRQPLDNMEALASPWVQDHPEYDQDLVDVELAIHKDYSVDGGQENPFLHLSMHLSIQEQCSIDQPKGVRLAVEQLAKELDSLHLAHHAAMECLGLMLWESQRSGLPPDGHQYLESLQKRATRGL
ncbi:MAG: DUF1841 family protein [Betaproteobacteria bacterium]|jgi:hypothetical protein